MPTSHSKCHLDAQRDRVPNSGRPACLALKQRSPQGKGETGRGAGLGPLEPQVTAPLSRRDEGKHGRERQWGTRNERDLARQSSGPTWPHIRAQTGLAFRNAPVMSVVRLGGGQQELGCREASGYNTWSCVPKKPVAPVALRRGHQTK